MNVHRLRALALLLASAALALPLAACNKESVHTFGETEGAYLDAGPLVYQVQISRQLNPSDTEDRPYLEGLSKQDRLAANETWFAVFMRVQNETDEPQESTGDFEIVDTLGNHFEPVSVARSNPFAYQPAEIPAGGEVLPSSGSAAASGPIQGSMLLFKLQIATLANRPLELRIKSPAGAPAEASVDLDV